MKIKIGILVFLFSTFMLFGQTNKTIDSLKQSLLNDKIHDTTKVSMYLLLGKEFAVIDLDSSGFYIKNASLGYDLEIVYKTFIKMVFGDPKAK